MEVKKLITWSHENFSDLPWRKNRSVYSTWISEVMLQQTTVYTVKSRLDKFLQQFPSVNTLASSSEEELLVAWKGLGYYQRAKNLRKAAIYIRDNFNGELPKDIESLLSIPGIGPYTSSAIASIGMDQKALAVDANLERVIARYYGITIFKGPKLKNEIENKFLSREIMYFQSISWRDVNEALMDLGRVICQARKAECVLCPIRKGCVASSLDSPIEIPMISPKIKKEKFELDLLRLITLKNKKIAVVKKERGEWLSGQYELPTFVIKTNDPKLSQYPKYEKKVRSSLPMIKTGITKYKIQNYYKEMSSEKLEKLGGGKKHIYISLKEAGKKLSTASLKILEDKGIIL